MSATVVAQDSANDTVSFAYYHYPPDMVVEDSKYIGRYANMVRALTNHANLNLHLLRLNVQDEYRLLNSGTREFCGTGRSHNPEREKRWQFLPYVFDMATQYALVVHQDQKDKINNKKDMTAVMRDETLIGTFMKHSSYGNTIESNMATMPAERRLDAFDEASAIEQVLRGRAHYAIVSQQQYDYAKSQGPEFDVLATVAGKLEYSSPEFFIVCSKSVKPEIIAKLSKAMAELGYPPFKF